MSAMDHITGSGNDRGNLAIGQPMPEKMTAAKATIGFAHLS